MWGILKHTKRPLHESLEDEWAWPNTITLLVASRMRYDSYQELPEVPPEEWWDFPRLIERHIEKVYPHTKKSTSAEVMVDDIEG